MAQVSMTVRMDSQLKQNFDALECERRNEHFCQCGG